MSARDLEATGGNSIKGVFKATETYLDTREKDSSGDAFPGRSSGKGSIVEMGLFMFRPVLT
jgi:hypothetical protein